MNVPRNLSALLIDDDRMTREVLASLLRTEGLEVDVTDRGAQALQLMEHREYDLLICDLRLRGMDGLELLRTVRDSHSEIVPIVVSGHDELIREAQARGHCAAAITKPFHLEELMAVIYKSLDERLAGSLERS